MSNLMRLDKFLSHMKIGSRKEIKQMVRAGRVRVNGNVARDSADGIRPGIDRITLDEQEVIYKEFVYIMLNKPGGYISATRDNYEKTVLDLLPDEWAGWELFPVGRLDKDTEGLLLLTNDGQLAHCLLAPKSHVPKTYFVRIKGEIDSADITRLESGMVLDDGYRTKPAGARILTTGEKSEVELVIYEGKFHQVKRMFATLGKEVIYLKRLAMGGLKLDPKLKTGEYRELTAAEVGLLE